MVEKSVSGGGFSVEYFDLLGRSIRTLSLALVVVASMLAVALLWALVGELRREPETAAATPTAPDEETLEEEAIGELLPPEESLSDE